MADRALDGPLDTALDWDAMRPPAVVLAQALAFAAGDGRVRALLLNGSRAHPAYAPDRLSDYDLLCAVTDIDTFAEDAGWLAHFGAPLLMQRPMPEPEAPWRRAWLVIFEDGVRIDFTLSPVEQIAADARADALTRLLLDKDGIVPPLEPPSGRSHAVTLPAPAAFAAACNEFWWVLLYAAKGLRRGQLLYARHTFDCIVRPELERVLVWWAAAQQGRPVEPGAFNKRLPELLPPALWAAYRATFAAPEPEANWAALDAAAALMAQVAPPVAAAIGAVYDMAEERNARQLLRAIRQLERL